MWVYREHGEGWRGLIGGLSLVSMHHTVFRLCDVAVLVQQDFHAQRLMPSCSDDASTMTWMWLHCLSLGMHFGDEAVLRREKEWLWVYSFSQPLIFCQKRYGWFRSLLWWHERNYNDMTTMTEWLCVLYSVFLEELKTTVLIFLFIFPRSNL